jgi:hypothetical protein
MTLHVSKKNLSHLASRIEHDVGSSAKFVTKSVGSAGKYIIDADVAIMKDITGTVKSGFSSLSLPLVLVGGAVLFFMIKK